MVELQGCEGGPSSSKQERNRHLVVPKPESLDYEFPCDTASQPTGDNVASSSGSKVKSVLLEMGFQPSFVHKAIEENGEDDVDLLLAILTRAPVTNTRKNTKSRSIPFSSPVNRLKEPKQEPDCAHEDDHVDRRIVLLSMSFPENFVDFAIDKLGKDAPIDEMVDFIVAAQLAEKLNEESEAEYSEEEADEVPANDRRVEASEELLFEKMNKTLHLLEMGFSDHEISLAIEKLGSKGQISELAETIITGEIPEEVPIDLDGIEEKVSAAPARIRACPSKNWRFLGVKREDGSGSCSTSTTNVKPDPGSDSLPFETDGSLEETIRKKRVKDEEYDEDAYPEAFSDIDHRGKRVRSDYAGSSSSWVEENNESKEEIWDLPIAMQPRLSQALDPGLAKRPYFFFGTFANTSQWSKISSFLYDIHPELVNTKLYSALSRKEGYVHNLPIEKRFRVLPKQVTTIQNAFPHLKSWWPSWDTRKHLNGICSKTSGLSQLCDRLGHLLAQSRGLPSPQQQKLILEHCHASNLIWIAPKILSPVEPEHLECIMGYPSSHTDIGGMRSAERLKLFEYCFQTDTIGYHLSVLKGMFPAGITVLSICSGIGGAEVALDRLGIGLKGVVSVEASKLSRDVLKRWWQRSGQKGELVQLEEIRRLTAKKLKAVMERFGGFDLIICQNPSTPPDLSQESQPSEFDFPSFNEFVRVLHRVRDIMATG